MEIEVIIESDLTEFTAREVSRWLACVASIRDALALMNNEYVWWYFTHDFLYHPYYSNRDQLYYIESVNEIRGPFPLRYYLRQLGLDLRTRGQIPPRGAGSTARRALIQVDDLSQETADLTRGSRGPIRGPEVLSVSKGSISTRVKEGIDWVASHLGNLLGQANGFIQAKDREEFYKSVAEIAPSPAPHRADLDVSVGLLVASGLTLEEILTTLQARSIQTNRRDSAAVTQS
jgi:hypothetical protein